MNERWEQNSCREKDLLNKYLTGEREGIQRGFRREIKEQRRIKKTFRERQDRKERWSRG